jgi:hypothetical protein
LGGHIGFGLRKSRFICGFKYSFGENFKKREDSNIQKNEDPIGFLEINWTEYETLEIEVN